MVPAVSWLDELIDGVGVLDDTLGVDDVDPVGEDDDEPVGVGVDEVLVTSGATVTCGYLGSAVSDPVSADCSEAAKADVVAAAGAVALL
jgi:hypothetical protein